MASSSSGGGVVFENPLNGGEGESCLITDRPVGLTLITETHHQSFLLVRGLWTTTEGPSCPSAVFHRLLGAFLDQ